MKKEYRFLSTGGLGDAWIVMLKISDIICASPDGDFHVDWLHVESHDQIKTQCEHLFKSLDSKVFEFAFECDPNYVQNVKSGKWKDRTALSTSMDGKCDLHGNTPALSTPFATHIFNRAYDMMQPPGSSSESLPCRHDICIQVSAGAKNDRNWKFDPRHFAAILRKMGYSVALVGNDLSFKDDADEDNFVGHSPFILDTTDVVRGSGLFIGLSGFLNYYASSMHVPNIHVIESAEHDKRYYHEKWKDLCVGIEYPTLQAVREALKKFNVTSSFRPTMWSCQKFQNVLNFSSIG